MVRAVGRLLAGSSYGLVVVVCVVQQLPVEVDVLRRVDDLEVVHGR